MTTTRGEPAVDEVAEQVLWDRAAGGDHAAFTQVFHRHFDAVWSHAYRLTGSRAAAEDLTASTFLTAWRRRADVQLTRETARPWLMAVTTNLSRTAWRSGARQDRALRRLGPPPDTADHSDAVAGAVDDTVRLRRVLAAVEQLSPALREAVGLCFIGNLSTADAAHALGVAEVTVRSRISRALGAALPARRGPVMDELRLPAAPPAGDDVRARVLARVLAELDQVPPAGTAPGWFPSRPRSPGCWSSAPPCWSAAAAVGRCRPPGTLPPARRSR